MLSGELEVERRKKNPYETRSLIIVGSENVGKTTIVYRFLDKDGTVNPTEAVEYSFARKPGNNLMKQTVRIWEVDYATPMMLQVALLSAGTTFDYSGLTVLIVLDLSRPEILWLTFEAILSNVRKEAEFYKNLQDPKCDFSYCIVGGKYDLFKDFDADIKETVGKMLRTVAHILHAGLFYHSSKDKTLLRKTKDLLRHHGFCATLSGDKCTDYEKPLWIPAGSDSLSAIDPQLSRGRPEDVMATIKEIYITRIQQEPRSNVITSKDPSYDANFNEPIIDRLRARREEEINVLLEDMKIGPDPQIPIADPS